MKVRKDLLQETYECVLEENVALAFKIKKILQGSPVNRLPLANDKCIDYYAVRLSNVQISEIASILRGFEAGAVSETGDTTPAASHYRSMVVFWNGLLSEDD